MDALGVIRDHKKQKGAKGTKEAKPANKKKIGFKLRMGMIKFGFKLD